MDLKPHRAMFDHDCQVILDRLVQHLEFPTAKRFLMATQGWDSNMAWQYVNDYADKHYVRLKCCLIDRAMSFLDEYKHILVDKENES